LDLAPLFLFLGLESCKCGLDLSFGDEVVAGAKSDGCLVFCLFFLLLCQLGMNPNPSTPVFFTMLAPVTEPILGFSSSLSFPLLSL
jgi:hypothetical protein